MGIVHFAASYAIAKHRMKIEPIVRCFVPSKRHPYRTENPFQSMEVLSQITIATKPSIAREVFVPRILIEVFSEQPFSSALHPSKHENVLVSRMLYNQDKALQRQYTSSAIIDVVSIDPIASLG